MVSNDETLEAYIKSVFDSMNLDGDVLKAIRRLHIKEVHLRRKGMERHAFIVKKAMEALQGV